MQGLPVCLDGRPWYRYKHDCLEFCLKNDVLTFLWKMKVMTSLSVIPYKQFEPHNHCAHFIYTFQTPNPPRFTAPSKKPDFRPLFADLGHFLTSDVILKENFCRLASIWLIDLMKLFALGRIDSAVVRKLCFAGKAGKVHRNGGYPAAHFEFCRSSVTPSGPPSALTSSTGGVVAGHRSYSKQSCVGGVVCVDVWCS